MAVQLGGSYCEVLDNYIHDMMDGRRRDRGQGSTPDGNRDYSAVAHNRIAYNKVYHSEFGFMLGGNDWMVENNEVCRLWMYLPGQRYDDCDYTRFFGKGCVERYNYFHGSTQKEIKVAHVDCIQTFTDNGEIAKDALIEYNTVLRLPPGLHGGERSAHRQRAELDVPRRHLLSQLADDARRLGPGHLRDARRDGRELHHLPGGLGLRRPAGQGIHQRAYPQQHPLRGATGPLTTAWTFTPSNPVIEYNLAFSGPGIGRSRATTNINNKDPMFVDAQQRDFRLRKGSPAIGAGKGGVTIGALEWPNVYYVDPRHPAAADEPAWGYPGVPLATASKACAIAQEGETIVLRGGVYRETLRPASDGVTIRAMKGEKVTISGADAVEGWKRGEGGAWWAPLSAEPKTLLRDGQPWSEFTYDEAAKRIVVKAGGDPRLHLFETVVRDRGIDLAGRKDVKVEGVEVVHTLGEASPGAK